MIGEKDTKGFNPFSEAKRATDQGGAEDSGSAGGKGVPAASGPRPIIPKGLPSSPLKLGKKSEVPSETERPEAHLETADGIIFGSDVEKELAAQQSNIQTNEDFSASESSLLEQMAAFDMEQSVMFSGVEDVSNIEAAAAEMGGAEQSTSAEQDAMWAAQLAADEESQWAEQQAAAYEAQWEDNERMYAEPPQMPPPNPIRRPDLHMDFDFDAGLPKKKSKLPLVLAIIIVLLIVGGVLTFFLLKEDPVQEAGAEQEEVKEDVVEIVPLPPLDSVNVKIELPEDASLFINGDFVERSDSSTYPVIKGMANSIIIYREGYIPFQERVVNATEGQEISPVFESDAAYLKTKMVIKLDDRSQASGMKASFDGKVLGEFPAEVENVILGFPHHLIVEKEGLARHLLVTWPGKSETIDINVPSLLDLNKSIRETLVKSEMPINRAKPYKMKIQTTKHVVNESGEVTVAKNDLLDYEVSRENRKTAQFVLNPNTFGTVNLSFFLNMDSLGTAEISFFKIKKAKTNIGICFRRVGEVICPDMNEKTTMPSGDWEVMGYVAENGEKNFLRGNFTQPLKMGYVYELVAASTKPEFFEMAVKSETRAANPNPQ